MTVYDAAVAKIRMLPASLAQEVNDFIDYLLSRKTNAGGSESLHAIETVESDFSDYLENLQEYEKRLANGEITW